jgi:hypothetical protein
MEAESSRICLRPPDPMLEKEKWMCMYHKSRDDWPEAIADDGASILWSCGKRSFLLKELHKAPRESQFLQ